MNSRMQQVWSAVFGVAFQAAWRGLKFENMQVATNMAIDVADAVVEGMHEGVDDGLIKSENAKFMMSDAD